MDITLVYERSPIYPIRLQQELGCAAPPVISLAGNPGLLSLRTLGLLCSVQCPGDVILRTYDLVGAMRDARIPMIGGFHSPMEKECLSCLLGGLQPVLICLGRSLQQMRLPSGWTDPLNKGRLLLLSCFNPKHRRLTAPTAHLRNRHVTALADQVLAAYAAPGGQTERLCRELLGKHKRIWTVASKDSAHLVALGARPLTLDRISELGLDAESLTTTPVGGVTGLGGRGIVV